MIDLATLANYGILGLWTASLLIEKYKLLDKLARSVDKLADAIMAKL